MDLIRDRRRTGRENMAADVALLERGEPTVRLYGWRPACVSLGYTQDEEEALVPGVRQRHGIDVVERPTGGGAILHDASEVTYAVVLPTDHPGLPDELFASYAYMAQGVLDALRGLGLEAAYRKATGGKDAFCYLREAGVSVCVDGAKVSGGAQRRTRTAVLQHGTVLVEGDPALQAELFGQPVDRVRAGVTSLADQGIAVERGELVERLANAFVGVLEPDRLEERGPEAIDALLAPAAPPA